MSQEVIVRCVTCKCAIWQEEITSNLYGIARQAGLIDVICLKEPMVANELVERLKKGIRNIRRDFEKYDKEVSKEYVLGSARDLLEFCEEMLVKCEQNPHAMVESK